MPNKLPKSDLQVELTLRAGGIQILTKGSITDLAKEIGAILAFANLATSTLSGSEPEQGAPTAVRASQEEIPGADIPVIKASRSSTDNIRALFSTPWGKTPKSLNDVEKALEVNGVPDSQSNIGTLLLQLVRAGELRRLKREGKWTYFRIPTE